MATWFCGVPDPFQHRAAAGVLITKSKWFIFVITEITWNDHTNGLQYDVELLASDVDTNDQRAGPTGGAGVALPARLRVQVFDFLAIF